VLWENSVISGGRGSLTSPFSTGSGGNYTLCSAIATCFSGGATAQTTPDPIGRWKLNEGGQSLIAIDSSGLGNKGTWAGSQVSSSYYNGGYVLPFSGNFNGTNDTVTAAAIAPTFPYTLSAWIYISSIPAGSGNTVILANTSTTSGDVFMALDEVSSGHSGDISCGYYNGSTFQQQISTSAVPLNTWTQVGCTYTSALLVTNYVAGAAAGSSTLTGSPLLTGTWTMNIGGPTFFTGLIEDVRLYSLALTGAQMATLAGKGPGVL